MSKKPSMSALKEQIDAERRPQIVPPASPPIDVLPNAPEGQGGRIIRGKRYPTYREGKVPVGGYYSFELSAALHQLANEDSMRLRRRVKIQELLGEAIDLLFDARGKHRFNER